jgi:putative redox protein
MTIVLYARKKGMALKSVCIRLSHDRVHADDCAACEEEGTHYVETINREIELKGDLSQAEQERLLFVASRCPVHRTLQAQPKVFDSLKMVS